MTEKIDGEDFDFLLDMDVGTCSCLRGVRGAACRHQAAVTKKYNIEAVNIPPFFSKEARRNFAIMALGKNHVLDLNFYAGLRDEPTSSSLAEMKLTTPISDSSNSNASHITDTGDPKHVCNVESSSDEWTSVIHSFKNTLSGITEDILSRVETGDGNMLSGVNAFIKSYKQMQSLISPTPSIAHALHQFGKIDSKNY